MCLAQGYNIVPPVGTKTRTLDSECDSLPLRHSAALTSVAMANKEEEEEKQQFVHVVPVVEEEDDA